VARCREHGRGTLGLYQGELVPYLPRKYQILYKEHALRVGVVKWKSKYGPLSVELLLQY